MTSAAKPSPKILHGESEKDERLDPPSNKVCFRDPAQTDDETSSEQEEYQLGEIWGNRGSDRRLSLDTVSSGNSKQNASESGRTKRNQNASRHRSGNIGERKSVGKKTRKRKEKSRPSSDSSSSSSSDISSRHDSRKRRKSESRRISDRASRNDDNMPDFTKRPTTKANRPPVRMQVDSEVFPGKRPRWNKMDDAMRDHGESKQEGRESKIYQNAKVCQLCHARLWKLRA